MTEKIIYAYHRLRHWPLSLNVGRNGLALALGRLLIDLRDDRLHFGLVVLQLYFLLLCGGWGGLFGATVTLACEPPSTSELLATAIPCLDHILVDVHGGIDVRDRYLVTGFDVAHRDEVHLRVAAFERRSGAWVARVRDLMCCRGPGRSIYVRMEESERERSRRTKRRRILRLLDALYRLACASTRCLLVLSLAEAMIDGFPRVEYKLQCAAGREREIFTHLIISAT